MTTDGMMGGLSPMMTLNDGQAMPQLGLGLMRFGSQDMTQVVMERAYAEGYRLFDTASVYKTETQTGDALRALGNRADLFVTTKVWNSSQGREEATAAFGKSLDRLGLDYLDLYLIHWPLPLRDRYVDTWRALIDLRESGRVRSIGVSNFCVEHLKRIIGETGVAPAVNQVEAHPYFQQAELRAFHATHGIVTQAWSPFGGGGNGQVGKLLDDPVIADIADRRGCTPSQVVLGWHVALGMSVIPKATGSEHLAQNIAAVNVTLDAADMAALAALDLGAEGRCGPDPMTLDFAGEVEA